MGRDAVKVDPSKFVVIRVWPAKVNGEIAGTVDAINAIRDGVRDVNVGHVSLQVVINGGESCRYASFWPSETIRNPDKILKGKFHKIDEDMRIEGENPHNTYILFSLDIDKLWDAVEPERLAQRFPNYTLIDGEAVRKKAKKKVKVKLGGGASENDSDLEDIKPQSCTGFVYSLVTENGYGLNYLDTGYDIGRAFVTTPENMNKLFSNAVASERIHWPDTKGYKQNVGKLLFNLLSSKTTLKEFNAIYPSFEDLLHTEFPDLKDKLVLHEQKLEPFNNHRFFSTAENHTKPIPTASASSNIIVPNQMTMTPNLQLFIPGLAALGLYTLGINLDISSSVSLSASLVVFLGAAFYLINQSKNTASVSSSNFSPQR